MGVNILSERRLRRIGETIGAQVVWGWVQSHHESGRYAFVTTVEHQHYWFDRRDRDCEPSTGRRCPSSCRTLFDGDPAPEVVLERARQMRQGGN